MREKEFRILGLSHNQTSIGSFVAVLGESDGDEKIPVIIKSSEAHEIASILNGKNETKSHGIYELVRSVTKHFSIHLRKIEVYKVLEGIFYVRLNFSNYDDEVYLECSIGEALVLSALYGMSIHISKEVSDQYAIILNDDGSVDIPKQEPEEVIEDGIEKLEHLIKEALADEEYEKAAKLRDELEILKGK